MNFPGMMTLASALAWDKSVAKHLFVEHGVPTPPWVTFTADAFKDAGAASEGAKSLTKALKERLNRDDLNDETRSMIKTL